MYKVTKTGYMLRLGEEFRRKKSAGEINFALDGFDYYQVITLPNATDTCLPHSGAIYRVDDAEEGVGDNGFIVSFYPI